MRKARLAKPRPSETSPRPQYPGVATVRDQHLLAVEAQLQHIYQKLEATTQTSAVAEENGIRRNARLAMVREFLVASVPIQLTPRKSRTT